MAASSEQLAQSQQDKAQLEAAPIDGLEIQRGGVPTRAALAREADEEGLVDSLEGPVRHLLGLPVLQNVEEEEEYKVEIVLSEGVNKLKVENLIKIN